MNKISRYQILATAYLVVILASCVTGSLSHGAGLFRGKSAISKASRNTDIAFAAKSGCEHHRKTFLDGFIVQLRFQTVNLDDLKDRKDHNVELNGRAEVGECIPTEIGPTGVIERYNFSLGKQWSMSLRQIEGGKAEEVEARANTRFVGSFFAGKLLATWEQTVSHWFAGADGIYRRKLTPPWFYLETPSHFFTKILRSLHLEDFDPIDKERLFAFLFLDHIIRPWNENTFVTLGAVKYSDTGNQYALRMLNSIISGD